MNNNVVILHPEKGANIRKLVCPRCSKPSGTIALGTKDFAGICGQCKILNIGLDETATRCLTCDAEGIEPVRIPPGDTIPKICDACTKEMELHRQILEKGGVMWECEDCTSTGMIEGAHPVAVETRQRTGVLAPEPCLARLTKESCPVCLSGGIH